MSNLESTYLLHQHYGKTIKQRTLWCKEMDIDKEIEGKKGSIMLIEKHYANREALWKLIKKC